MQMPGAGDERGNPHLGENTDFKNNRVGRSLAMSDAPSGPRRSVWPGSELLLAPRRG